MPFIRTSVNRGGRGRNRRPEDRLEISRGGQKREHAAHRLKVAPLKSRFPRANIDLAQRGAWSAAIGHVPRVLSGAVGTKGRAQLVKEAFCMGVILTSACSAPTDRRGGAHQQHPAPLVGILDGPPEGIIQFHEMLGSGSIGDEKRGDLMAA